MVDVVVGQRKSPLSTAGRGLVGGGYDTKCNSTKNRRQSG